MTERVLVGVAVGSGGEAVDGAVVRVAGSGLGIVPALAAAVRVPLPPGLNETPASASRDVGEVMAAAVRQACVRGGIDARAVLAAGVLTRLADGNTTPAEWLAELTGTTVVTGFRGRDRAAGGSGQFITPAADYLMFRHPDDDRLLVHLGSATNVLLIPAGGKISDVVGYEAGPGTQLLDELIRLGTRGQVGHDAGGTRAVQGRRLEPLIERWRTHPFAHRPPPKSLARSTFGLPFQTDAFEQTRELGGSLNDLLCSASHYVADMIGTGVRAWLPAGDQTRQVYVSGGGVRNGFLWKLVAGQFSGHPVDRLDAIGVPAGARSAAAAAVLAGLTIDGVPGNLPLLTGAAGGRLIGRIIPGDLRNWSACASWMARQTADSMSFMRAA